MFKRIGACAFVIAAGVMAGPANAGYFGLGVAQNTLEDWDESTFDDGSISNADAEDSDNGFRIFGGGAFSPNFGFELGYSDFGEATWEGTSDGTGGFWPAGPVGASVGLKGFDGSLVGTLPVSDAFALMARFGILVWDMEVDVDTSVGSGSDSDDGNDTFFGLGGELRTGDAIALRAEYTAYSIDDGDMNSLSFSLVYRPK